MPTILVETAVTQCYGRLFVVKFCLIIVFNREAALDTLGCLLDEKSWSGGLVARYEC